MMQIRKIGFYSVTPGYVSAIGARIVTGRDLSARDRADAPPVALINEAGARFWFPGEDPVGRRVVIGSTEREIVGVMSDVLHRDPSTPPRPQLFAPYEQQSGRSVQIVVRTAGDPLALAPAVRTLIRSMGPTVTIGEFRPLDQVVAATLARPRFYTSLLTLFAAIALTLAAVGIFGVMSYLVAQRSREISIRMALGADAGSVTRMVVGSAMKVAAAGLIVGLGCAIAVGGVLRSQLYGVGLTDPVTLAGVLALLGVSAAVASYIPARRAARLEPGAALKG
jgi:putative ABC transport system permease protein